MQRNKIIAVLENEKSRDFIISHLNSDTTKLGLKYHKKVDFDLSTALTLIETFQKSEQKLPTFHTGLCAFTQLNAEQASSEITADYKSSRFKANRIADLTGGLGVDTYFFGKRANQVLHCEMDEQAHENAIFNFKKLNAVNIQCVHNFTGDFRKELSRFKPDLIYVDPDRRPGRSIKTFALENASPNIIELMPTLLEISEKVLVKLSPMIDITYLLNTFNCIKEINVVSIKNEVKEVLVFLKRGSDSDSAIIRAVDIRDGEFLEFENPEKHDLNRNLVLDKEPVEFLFDPAKVLVKCRLDKAYAYLNGFRDLSRHNSLVSSDVVLPNLMGRYFEVLEVLPANWKKIKSRLKTLEIESINLISRSFPESTNKIRTKLKLKEGGEYFLICTKRNSNHVCYLSRLHSN